MTKITIATVKSFIATNADILFVKNESEFCGSTDMVEQNTVSKFTRATKTTHSTKNTLGIRGLWFVGGGNDSFRLFSENGFFGYEVFNCCGSFLVALREV